MSSQPMSIAFETASSAESVLEKTTHLAPWLRNLRILEI